MLIYLWGFKLASENWDLARRAVPYLMTCSMYVFRQQIADFRRQENHPKEVGVGLLRSGLQRERCVFVSVVRFVICFSFSVQGFLCFF